jgi:acetolactate synthase-1/2/3 large subunit
MKPQEAQAGLQPASTMAAPTSSRRAICDALIGACRRAGSSHLFGVPGGGVNLDVIGVAENHGIRFVVTHTETAAAIMAAVMGELTGTPGLCVATRGPGAASTVNGVAHALLDRQPLIAITDCVARADRARISHQRLDQPALFAAVTKASVILDGRDPAAPTRLVDLARSGRPGPVHVDIDPTAAPQPPVPAHSPPPPPDEAARARLQSLLTAAEHPTIVVGVGSAVAPPGARAELARTIARIAARANIPVLCTYRARGFADDSSTWSAGVVSGATIEAPLLHQADLIVGIGFDPVELIPNPWPYQAPVALLGSWHIDDSNYFGDRLRAELVGDLRHLVAAAAGWIGSSWPPGAGQEHRRRAEQAILDAAPTAPAGLTPQQVVTLARVIAPQGTTVTVDAGAHMFPAMHLWHTDRPAHVLISSGLATMGFALPAAIAAALARSPRPVICFTGDGGLGMALAELETLARLDLPVIVVVFNDAALSLIAAKQQPHGQGGANAVRYRRTDFAALARACGLDAHRIEDADSYRAALRQAVESGRPTLLDVLVDPSAYPCLLDTIRGPRRDPR